MIATLALTAPSQSCDGLHLNKQDNPSLQVEDTVSTVLPLGRMGCCGCRV
jgi:hypothetical protein